MCYKINVMYETMSLYPLSWAYYISFIFFTAFAFLNMVIGIVVNVLDQEKTAYEKMLAVKKHKLTQLDRIERELKDLKKLLDKTHKNP